MSDAKPGGALTTKPLRVGLLVDSLVQPRWIVRLLEQLRDAPYVELAVVVCNSGPRPGVGAKPDGASRRRSPLLYRLYRRLDAWWFSVPRDAFATESVERLLSDSPRLEIQPVKRGIANRFEPRDVERIREYRLDVALRFGFGILRGEALEIATHGVWSYHHADNRINRGGPAGFWEVAERRPTTGTILQVLNNELDNGTVIYRSCSKTDPVSVKKNRNVLFWKSSDFALRKLRDLHRDGRVEPAPEPPRTELDTYYSRLYRVPGNLEMLRILGSLFSRYCSRKWTSSFFRGQWALCYRLTRTTDRFAPVLYRYTRAVPPKDRFWADPFPIKRDGKHYVFFEEYLERTRKGHIAVLQIDSNREYGQPVKVLERDYHLAYPFLFEWNGELYMIPSSDNDTVELYRCRKFPLEWEFDRILLKDARAVDTTLARIDGRWWMFTTIAAPGTRPTDELLLFHADTPLGPWKPHLRNPVKSDVRGSRPAGAIFEWQGRNYRPAQDCSIRYGHGIVLQRILRISPEVYEEEEVGEILPEWERGLLGVHTLNFGDGLTVIDCLKKRRR